MNCHEIFHPIRNQLFASCGRELTRSAVLQRDETSRQCWIAVAAGPDGNYRGAEHPGDTSIRELNFIRAGLSDLRVREVFAANLNVDGYFLLVEPVEPIEVAEHLADGCWSLTARGTIQAATLLQALTALAWDAWRAVMLPELEKEITEREAMQAQWDDGELDDSEEDPCTGGSMAEEVRPAPASREGEDEQGAPLTDETRVAQSGSI
jgi:hypothetical protein